MSGVPESNASSQASRGTKRKWVPEEDAALVSYMVDLHNVGTFNADTGFKAGYLNELERIHRTFPYYDQLTTIYARDRATGKDVQTAADVLEEINAEDVHTTGMDEERNSFYDCEADISLDDMDVSAVELQRDRDQG
ncbi:hypothetical protein Gotur_026128, partial [Gossypium turneri]